MSTRAILFIIALTLWTVHPAASLKKHVVMDASSIGATCNDGSPATYYLQRVTSSDKWIIYLEGGGGCSSDLECQQRWMTSQYLMSSTGYPEYITERGLFTEKYLANYNKALLVYCSSDFWLGNSSQNVSVFQPKNSTNIEFNFRGFIVYTAILSELIILHGLHEAKYVVLGGSSAGGVGAANHATQLRTLLPTAEISLLLDSAWFVNYNQVFNKQPKSFLLRSGLTRLDTCRDFSWGMPCCLSIACMINRGHIDPKIHVLALVSKYDIYVLFKDIFQSLKSLKSEKVLLDVHSYGGQVTQSVQMIEKYPMLSLIQTSCFQHVYLVTSSLWETMYESVIEKIYPSVTFKHEVKASHIRTIAVQGKPIGKYIHYWIENIQNQTMMRMSRTVSVFLNARDALLSRLPNVKVMDSCRHAQCNPTCPQNLYFHTDQNSWSIPARWFLATLVLIIVLICLLTKLSWTIRHYLMIRAQRRHVVSSYQGNDVKQKIMCLPTCPPHSNIGISCSMLEYEVPNTANDAAGMIIRLGSLRQRKPSVRNFRRRSEYGPPGKRIIKGVSAYFNPGQLVAIMGPSGSGKTTLLDVLTARKHLKEAEASIFINGLPAAEARDWFIQNSGYVLQLATPYNPELTVRQNLTYSALMRLPSKMAHREKIWRVEQVIGQAGLFEFADVVVGGSTGGGLSGGQKRRLCIALQLLDLPSVLFLDEPTSGLDSASSLELLETLHSLTLSGRLVVVTIHQPRLEIFHMFDTILFLCDGKVAFFGSPIMAPGMIAEALQGSGQVFDASNPADTIMDVLTNDRAQNIIVSHYFQSGEIESINQAIQRARRHPQKPLTMDFKKETSSVSNRFLALDGRSSASQTLGQRLYFPLVFLMYSLALGTCYWQTNEGVLLLSCYMVFSCASQLFMASVINAHLHREFSLFSLEKADGFGHSHELVLHTFIRIFSLASIPLTVACGIIYLCTIREYVLWKFVLTTLIHLQLSQAWIAIIILVACTVPKYCHLVTPLLSAISGFAGGFLVPKPQMPVFYAWLFYINPTHWAYSGMVKILLSDIIFDCELNSKLECQSSQGIIVLESFGLDQANPYLSMMLLLMFLLVFMIAAIIILEVRHTKLKLAWKKVKKLSPRRKWILLRNGVRRCWYDFRERKERKRLEEEEERKRLFELCEHKYEYKPTLTADIESQEPTSPGRFRKLTNGFRRRSGSTSEVSASDTAGEELTPKLDRKRAKEKIKERKALKKQKQEQAKQEKRLEMRARKEARSSTGSTGQDNELPGKSYSSSTDLNLNRKISEHSLTSNPSSEDMLHSDNDGRERKQRKSSKYRKRRRISDQQTWSRYLDSVARPHEVYCSLVGVKRRLRGGGRGVRGALKRQESMHVQRRVSTHILEERRRSMRFQMQSVRFVFGSEDEDATNPDMSRKKAVMRALSNVKKPAKSTAVRRNYISNLIAMSIDKVNEKAGTDEEIESDRSQNSDATNASAATDSIPPITIDRGSPERKFSAHSIRSHESNQSELSAGEARLVIRSKKSSPIASYRNSREIVFRNAQSSLEQHDAEQANIRKLSRLSRGTLDLMTTDDILCVIKKLDTIENRRLSNVKEEDKGSSTEAIKYDDNGHLDTVPENSLTPLGLPNTLSLPLRDFDTPPNHSPAKSLSNSPRVSPAPSPGHSRPHSPVMAAAGVDGGVNSEDAHETGLEGTGERDYDPLLPEERMLVQSLLNKYGHWNKRLKEQRAQEEAEARSLLSTDKYQFSTGVKISKGLSPNVSRRGSLKKDSFDEEEHSSPDRSDADESHESDHSERIQTTPRQKKTSITIRSGRRDSRVEPKVMVLPENEVYRNISSESEVQSSSSESSDDEEPEDVFRTEPESVGTQSKEQDEPPIQEQVLETSPLTAENVNMGVKRNRFSSSRKRSVPSTKFMALLKRFSVGNSSDDEDSKKPSRKNTPQNMASSAPRKKSSKQSLGNFVRHQTDMSELHEASLSRPDSFVTTRERTTSIDSSSRNSLASLDRTNSDRSHNDRESKRSDTYSVIASKGLFRSMWEASHSNDLQSDDNYAAGLNSGWKDSPQCSFDDAGETIL